MPTWLYLENTTLGERVGICTAPPMFSHKSDRALSIPLESGHIRSQTRQALSPEWEILDVGETVYNAFVLATRDRLKPDRTDPIERPPVLAVFPACTAIATAQHTFAEGRADHHNFIEKLPRWIRALNIYVHKGTNTTKDHRKTTLDRKSNEGNTLPIVRHIKESLTWCFKLFICLVMFSMFHAMLKNISLSDVSEHYVQRKSKRTRAWSWGTPSAGYC